jgi:hypothetical protein
LESNGSAVLRMCGSQNRRYSDGKLWTRIFLSQALPRFQRVLPFRSLPAGLVEHEPMKLIAPDKAARMAAIQNNLLPIYGVISHEGTKPRRIRAQRNPASNIQHPAPKPPPVLPASSKRSERVVKQSR